MLIIVSVDIEQAVVKDFNWSTVLWDRKSRVLSLIWLFLFSLR